MRPYESVWPEDSHSDMRGGSCLEVTHTCTCRYKHPWIHPCTHKHKQPTSAAQGCCFQSVILTGSITAGSPFCPFSPRDPSTYTANTQTQSGPFLFLTITIMFWYCGIIFHLSIILIGLSRQHFALFVVVIQVSIDVKVV